MASKIKVIGPYLIRYDKPRDVLYISIGSPQEALSEMDDEEFIVRYSKKDNSLCGITIINVKEYWLARKDQFSEHLNKYLSDLPLNKLLSQVVSK